MAFELKNLSLLAHTGGQDIAGSTKPTGFRLWHYETADLSAEIDTAGYFSDPENLVLAMLQTGDFIMTNTAVTGAIASGVFIVRSNDGTEIDVSNISSFGLANTD